MKDGKPERWEDGFNRIADLKLLSIQNQGSNNVRLDDHFNQYSVRFSMHFPLTKKEHMKINGDTPQLGSWKSGKGPIQMEQSPHEMEWLTG